jgi:hypothetical protein
MHVLYVYGMCKVVYVPYASLSGSMEHLLYLTWQHIIYSQLDYKLQLLGSKVRSTRQHVPPYLAALYTSLGRTVQ